MFIDENEFQIDIYLSFEKIIFINVPQKRRLSLGVLSSSIKLQSCDKIWNKFWLQNSNISFSELDLRILFGERQF